MREYLEYNTETKKSTFKELLEKVNSNHSREKSASISNGNVQSAK